jgi:HEAT repeat protein
VSPGAVIAAIAEGIAANLVTELLRTSTGKVRRGFDDRDARAALDAAVAEALCEALTAALPSSGDPLLRGHYESLLGRFFARETVVEELAEFLDPRPGAKPNPEVLKRELGECGCDPSLLVGFDPVRFETAFIQAFYSAAGRQLALQGRIEIRLLGEMVESLGAATRQQERVAEAAERTAEATERTADKVGELVALLPGVLGGALPEQRLLSTAQEVEREGFLPAWSAQEGLARQLLREGVDLSFEEDGTIDLRESGSAATSLPPARLAAVATVLRMLRSAVLSHVPNAEELRELERRYRQHLARWFESLTFQGLMRSPRPIVLPLEDVYVELRAVAEVPEAADAFSPEERRLLLELDYGAPEARRELMRQLDALRRERWSRSLPQRKPIAEALYERNRGGLVILGDPGSGKSTLLHFLTLIHARGEAAGRLGVAPEEADRLPIFVPLAAFDDMRHRVEGLTLLEFLPLYYDRRRGLPGLGPLFRRAIEAGRALVLLDGLDEVLDAGSRAYVAEQVGALVNEWAPRGVRFAITSRIVGYREAPVPGQLPTWSVLDFGPPEIELFARRWALAFEKWTAGGETAEALQRARQLENDLLSDVRSSESVRRLAANPLMLTMLALLRRQVGRLPNRRVLLYESYLGTLLENWMVARSLGARERSRDALDRLEAENVLIPLAFWLHENRPSGTAGRAEVQRCLEDVRLGEAGTSRERATEPQLRQAEREADRFLRELREMTGLLVERGLDAFGFLHQTFQEYYAGRALARLDDEERWRVLLPHLHDPRWREPILLCAGRLGVVENRRQQVTALVRSILACEDDLESELHRNLALALAVAADDVNLDPALVGELVERATACLPTGIQDLDQSLLDSLAQLVANGTADAERCFGHIWHQTYGLANQAVASLNRLAGNPTLREVLLSLLMARGDSPLTAVAALGLAGQADDLEVRSALIHSAREHREWARDAALSALVRSEVHDDVVRNLVRKWLGRRSQYEVRQGVRESVEVWIGRDEPMRRELYGLLEAGVVHRDKVATAFRGLREVVSTDRKLRARLLSWLADESDPDLQAGAAGSLAALAAEDAEVREALISHADDPSSEVCCAIIEGLGQLGAVHREEAIDRLMAALEDHDPFVRTTAVEALAPYWEAMPEVQRGILEAARDGSRYVRNAAADAIARHVDKPLAKQTLLALANDHDAWVSKMAWRSLVQTLTAADLLASERRTGGLTDAGRRQDLAAALGDSGIAHGTALLRELLDDAKGTEALPAIATLAEGLAERFPSCPRLSEFLAAALSSPRIELRILGIELIARKVREDRGALERVTRAIEDTSLPVRRTAIHAGAAHLATEVSIRKAVLSHLEDLHDEDSERAGDAALIALCRAASEDPVLPQVILEQIEAGFLWKLWLDPVREALAAVADWHVGVFEAVLRAGEEVAPYIVSAMTPTPEVRQLLLDVVQKGRSDDPRTKLAISALARQIDTDPHIADLFVEWLSGRGPFVPMILEGLWRVPVSEPRIVEILVTRAASSGSSFEGRPSPASEAIEDEAAEEVEFHAHVALYRLSLPATATDATRRALRDLAEGADVQLREIALGIFGRAEQESEGRDLLLAGLQDPAIRVRAAAAAALAKRTADPAIRNRLLQALNDAADEVVATACHALIAGGDDPSGRAALSIGMHHPSIRVRVATLEGLMARAPESAASPDLVPWLEGWNGFDYDKSGRFPAVVTMATTELRRRLAVCLAGHLGDSAGLCDRLRARLRDPRASSRLMAGLSLLAWPGGPPEEIVDELWAALDDWRCLESYPARLTAASYLLNREPHSEAAIALCLEALEYGTGPWEMLKESGAVRAQAALALGKLDPIHFEPKVFDRLRRLLAEDESEEVRNACYQTLLRLARLRRAPSPPPASLGSPTAA